MSETPTEPGLDTVGGFRRAVGWRDALMPIGVIAGLFVVVVLLFIVAMSIAKVGGYSSAGVHLYWTGMRRGFWFNTLLGDFFYAGLLIFLLRCLGRIDPASLVGKFAVPPSKWAWGAVMLGASFALFTIMAASQLAAHHVVQFHEAARDRLLQSHSLAQLLALILTVSVLAPLVEEIYFRNILLSLLKRKFGTMIAVVISALLFALVHFEFLDHPGVQGWIATGVLFGLGLINALWVARTRFLWLAIFSHAAYNSVLIVLPFALLSSRNS